MGPQKKLQHYLFEKGGFPSKWLQLITQGGKGLKKNQIDYVILEQPLSSVTSLTSVTSFTIIPCVTIVTSHASVPSVPLLPYDTQNNYTLSEVMGRIKVYYTVKIVLSESQ